MADQAAAKKILSELAKREDLKNKVCNDCTNVNPQWASLSFAVFLCLQCAGTHRGFGVHVSFVRSISMDSWTGDQIRRMQLGGNAPFREFMKSYTPQEQGGYNEDLSPYDTYHCWAATQYREKLDAELAGRPWSPSAPTEVQLQKTRSASPATQAGTRKSRASGRGSTMNSMRSDSPSPFRTSSRGTPNSIATDQKAANESYFEGLGKLNDNRPDHLPPNQGGKYTGFGNTPSPPAGSGHPSYGLSSRNAPSLSELQENPLGALSKGWSLFSAAVVGAGKAVQENVIQPGVERVTDPNFQATVKGYMTEAQKRAMTAGGTANQWSKQQLGVDVAGGVGGAVTAVRDRVGGGPQRDGYGALSQGHGYEEETSGLYDHDEDDFFKEYSGTGHQTNGNSTQSTSLTTATSSPSAPAAPKLKSNDWDDEWKDF